MATITIELSDERLDALKVEAARRGMAPEDLARSGIERMLDRDRQAFERAADYVLRKNAELYRRLAQ